MADPASYFSLMMFGQFIAWTTIYVLLDKFVSSDTGTKRQIMNTASDQISDIDNSIESPLSENLIVKHQVHTNNLKIRNLVKKFGNFTALNRVDLDINSNSVTCLLGHNGAGKTTLIDIMTGF